MSKTTIKDLIENEVIEEPMDGNHGELHPTSKDYVTKGIPFIMASDIEDGCINYETCKYISEETASKLRKGFAKEGDVLLTHKATIGRTAMVKNINTEYIVLTPQVTYYRVLRKDILDNRYLKYYFDSPKFQYILGKRAGAGSTRAYLGILQQQELNIEYPDIEIQRKIADILSSFDNKIENNKKINKELESMAKTIYDYWFLQFEFPNEEGKPYRSSGGKMVWNEELKREIPEGWIASHIIEIEEDIVTGKTPSTKDKSNYDGDIPFITIGDIRGHMHIVQTEQTLSKVGADSQVKKYIPKGAICVTCIASPGLVGFATKDSQTNQQINSIICKNKYNRIFLYFAIKDYFKYSNGAKTGNTFDNMNKDDFSKIPILYPRKNILEKFYEYVNSIDKRILNLEFENKELSELRDFLLPLLMNGQVEFKDNINDEISHKEVEEEKEKLMK